MSICYSTEFERLVRLALESQHIFLRRIVSFLAPELQVAGDKRGEH